MYSEFKSWFKKCDIVQWNRWVKIFQNKIQFGVGIGVGKISEICQNRQKSEKTKNLNS